METKDFKYQLLQAFKKNGEQTNGDLIELHDFLKDIPVKKITDSLVGMINDGLISKRLDSSINRVAYQITKEGAAWLTEQGRIKNKQESVAPSEQVKPAKALSPVEAIKPLSTPAGFIVKTFLSGGRVINSPATTLKSARKKAISLARKHHGSSRVYALVDVGRARNVKTKPREDVEWSES